MLLHLKFNSYNLIMKKKTTNYIHLTLYCTDTKEYKNNIKYIFLSTCSLGLYTDFHIQV